MHCGVASLGCSHCPFGGEFQPHGARKSRITLLVSDTLDKTEEGDHDYAITYSFVVR